MFKRCLVAPRLRGSSGQGDVGVENLAGSELHAKGKLVFAPMPPADLRRNRFQRNGRQGVRLDDL
jgi:hypothetical protein